jgi:hypothetical protein
MSSPNLNFRKPNLGLRKTSKVFVPDKIKKKNTPKQEETKTAIQEEKANESPPPEVEEEKFNSGGRF